MASKRARKIKKREKKVARDKLYRRQRALYPEIRVTGHADPSFQRYITKAFKKISWDWVKETYPEFIKEIRMHASKGMGHVLKSIKLTEPVEIMAYLLHLSKVLTQSAILPIIATYPFDKYLPFNSFRLIPRDFHWNLHFNSLEKKKLDGMNYYHIPWHSEVEIRDINFTLGFSEHSLRRLMKRAVGQLDNPRQIYLAATLWDCDSRISVTRHRGQYLLSLHVPLLPGEGVIETVESLLGALDEDYTYWQKVGYFPLHLEGSFALCKTLLAPGMQNTPEDRLLSKHPRYSEMDLAINNLGMLDLVIQKPELVRYFQESGYPQIYKELKAPKKK